MNRKSITSTILALIFCSLSLQAQSFKDRINNVYGGLTVIPIKTTDFTDFHISDWQNFGLGSGEGRVAVPLATNEPKTSFGLQIGANLNLVENLDGFLEINYGLSGISVIQVLAGTHFTVLPKDKFKLSLTPKLGYSVASADFGTITVLPGKTPPVILPEGTFREGDNLTMELSGLCLQLGATGHYTLNDQFGIYANLNFGLSFGSKGVLTASGTQIPMEAAGVVKDDFSSTQAGINPNAKIQGLGLAIGVTYKL